MTESIQTILTISENEQMANFQMETDKNDEK